MKSITSAVAMHMHLIYTYDMGDGGWGNATKNTPTIGRSTCRHSGGHMLKGNHSRMQTFRQLETRSTHSLSIAGAQQIRRCTEA